MITLKLKKVESFPTFSISGLDVIPLDAKASARSLVL